MIPLMTTVFLASLLGGLHCAGMCGAFLTFAVGGDPSTPRPPALLHAAYHTGRLVTYSMFGIVAGTFGTMLNQGGALVGLRRTSAVVAGVAMIGFGLVSILRAFGVRIRNTTTPQFMRSALLAGTRMAFDLAPVPRALLVGLLTTLLPCGWLYAFVITAAGTGGPLPAVATMGVFWLGTLPVMMTIGISIQCLTGALQRRLPVITSLAVVCVGLLTVLTRFALPMPALPNAATIVRASEERGLDSPTHTELSALTVPSTPLCHPQLP